MAGKENETKIAQRKCPSCGLPVSDPLILLCPRCRAALTNCTGCENCGACKKKN